MTFSRMFWPAVAFVVAVVGTLEVRSAGGETQTWDEGIHIAAGYTYLARGDYSWNIEHPPLVKLMSALPLFGLRLNIPPPVVAGKPRDQVRYGIDFLYRNRVHADSILIAACWGAREGSPKTGTSARSSRPMTVSGFEMM